MSDGIYNGYMKKIDLQIEPTRFGPGTLTHPDRLWRIEGYWIDN